MSTPEMKNLTFDDVFFTRMKLEKSIQLPKSPLKTPTFNQQHLPILNYLLKSFSPFKCIKQQNRYPTKVETDSWLVRKQVQAQEFIQKQNLKRQNLVFSDSNQGRIILRKRFAQQENKQENSNISKKTVDLSTDKKLSQPFGLNSKFSELKSKLNYVKTSIREARTSKKIQDLDISSQKRIRLNQRIDYYPDLLKSRQEKSKLTKYIEQNQSQKCILSKNDHNHKGTSLTQSYKDFKLFQRARSYSQKNSHSTSLIQSSHQNPCLSTQSPERKSLSRSINLSTQQSQKSLFRNPIYKDNLKGNRLIKKYSYRETSPDEKKDLKHKYSRLQKRLDGILRSVRTEKQPSD